MKTVSISLSSAVLILILAAPIGALAEDSGKESVDVSLGYQSVSSKSTSVPFGSSDSKGGSAAMGLRYKILNPNGEEGITLQGQGGKELTSASAAMNIDFEGQQSGPMSGIRLELAHEKQPASSITHLDFGFWGGSVNPDPKAVIKSAKVAANVVFWGGVDDRLAKQGTDTIGYKIAGEANLRDILRLKAYLMKLNAMNGGDETESKIVDELSVTQTGVSAEFKINKNFSIEVAKSHQSMQTKVSEFVGPQAIAQNYDTRITDTNMTSVMGHMAF